MDESRVTGSVTYYKSFEVRMETGDQRDAPFKCDDECDKNTKLNYSSYINDVNNSYFYFIHEITQRKI